MEGVEWRGGVGSHKRSWRREAVAVEVSLIQSCEGGRDPGTHGQSESMETSMAPI